jgi:hypothetical protein
LLYISGTYLGQYPVALCSYVVPILDGYWQILDSKATVRYQIGTQGYQILYSKVTLGRYQAYLARCQILYSSLSGIYLEPCCTISGSCL